jgi:hypothetical protein
MQFKKLAKSTVKTLAFFGVMFGLPLLGGCITQEPTVEEPTYTVEQTVTPKEQEYIVRYATPIMTDDNGITTYEDYDGNLWEVQDAPEIDGDVRILFNSMETFSIEDDIIIDITEIN